MTTVRIHSLTHGGTTGAVKAVIVTTAIQLAKVRRVIMLPSIVRWLMNLHCNHRSRQQLARLDSRLLEDIGISEAQRQACLRKPLWKLQGPGR